MFQQKTTAIDEIAKIKHALLQKLENHKKEIKSINTKLRHIETTLQTMRHNPDLFDNEK